jgi:hypothetical protein
MRSAVNLDGNTRRRKVESLFSLPTQMTDFSLAEEPHFTEIIYRDIEASHVMLDAGNVAFSLIFLT